MEVTTQDFSSVSMIHIAVFEALRRGIESGSVAGKFKFIVAFGGMLPILIGALKSPYSFPSLSSFLFHISLPRSLNCSCMCVGRTVVESGVQPGGRVAVYKVSDDQGG